MNVNVTELSQNKPEQSPNTAGKEMIPDTADEPETEAPNPEHLKERKPTAVDVDVE